MTVRKKLSNDWSSDMDDSKYPFGIRVASMLEKHGSMYSYGSERGSESSALNKQKKSTKNSNTQKETSNNNANCTFNQIQNQILGFIWHYFGKGCCKDLICCTGLNLALFLCALFGGLLVLLLMFQAVKAVFVNIPTVSFGLSLAWVSLATGTNAEEPQDAVVGGAGATHAASIIGVLLSAAALKTGRKPPLIASSAAFALCWGLKIHGGYWSIVVARLAAGLAGAAAWTAAPLMGREISSGPVRGAAAAAPVLAHNFGFLLMYAAADADLPHKVILWCCLSVSLFHCLAFLLVPESPPFLAASGKLKEARASLAWLRGIPADNPELNREIETLPPIEDSSESSLTLIKEIWTHRQRRRALILSVIAVAGQECCGLLALMQFAEQVFAEASGDAASPARHALILGAVQLIFSAMALYLVERVGRRPLIVWTAVICGGCLVGGAALSWAGGGAAWLAAALAGAVAADSLGMQPAPYALLVDMFDYRYRGCALLVATGTAAAGNALEVALFGAAATAGMHAALALAAALTIAYALFAIFALPETRNKDPEEIYDAMTFKKDKKCKDIEDPGLQDLGNPKIGSEKLTHSASIKKDNEDIYGVLYTKEENKQEQALEKSSPPQNPPEIFVTCEAKSINSNVKENSSKQNASTDDKDSSNELKGCDNSDTKNISDKILKDNSDINNKSDVSVVTVSSENNSNKETQWTSL